MEKTKYILQNILSFKKQWLWVKMSFFRLSPSPFHILNIKASEKCYLNYYAELILTRIFLIRLLIL